MISFTEFVTLLTNYMQQMGLPPASMQELEEEYRTVCREEAGKEQCQTLEGVMEYLS